MTTQIAYDTKGIAAAVVSFEFYDAAGTYLTTVSGTEGLVGVYTVTVPSMFVAAVYSIRIKYAGSILAVIQFEWSGSLVVSQSILMDSATSNTTPNKLTAGQAPVGAASIYDAGSLASGKNAAFITNQYNNLMNERAMLMDLNRESIAQSGIEVYYIQNPFTNVDTLYGEDRFLELQAVNTKKIVVYVKNAQDGYEGGAFFSKFGFQNRQNADFLISRATWNDVFGTLRPLEGDIIYLPRWNSFGPTDFMRVTFVDKFDANGFYPLGEHFTFTVSTEKWAYSSEKMSTGVAEIDAQEAQFSADVLVNTDLQAEDVKDNTSVQTISDPVIDWNVNNPFGRG